MYYSQSGQDRYLNEQHFKGRRDGVFVEIGAHDGVTISNTLFFERSLGWTGLCVEPIPERFDELVKNRRCTTLRGCAFDQNTVLDFRRVRGYSEMLSGIEAEYNPRHRDRISRERLQHGGSEDLIQVPAYKLSTLFENYGIPHVDYLSIDTEGSEVKVLAGIDFSKVTIDFISCEVNYAEDHELIRDLLGCNGYSPVHFTEGDIIFRHQRLA